MKKITLLLVFLLTAVLSSYGQVTVGEGTNTGQILPFSANYGYSYSYSQSLYLSSEINASGSITSIQWYYAGNGAMPNSQMLNVYLGQTTKNSFDSNADFIGLSEMTLVYTGGLTTASAPGWKTITFSTPFAYDGTSNLVVAVDENMAGYDIYTDKFYNTNAGANRSIFAYAETLDIDPNDLNAFGVLKDRSSFVPNIIVGGITQACATPTALTATQATTTQATIGWNNTSDQTNWEVYVVEQGEDAPLVSTVGSPVSGNSSFIKTDLTANTTYSAYVRAICSETLISSWSTPKNFTTLCDGIDNFIENFETTASELGLIPNCWTKVINSVNSSLDIYVTGVSSASSPNAIVMSNVDDTTATMLLITPTLNGIDSNTNRIKFKARGLFSEQILKVGTLTDPTDSNTFVELQSYTLGTTFGSYTLNLTTSITANHIAFKHGLGGIYRALYIDDVVYEAIPTALPECLTTVDASINDGCGNFPTTISWDAVSGADGYYVSIGTSEDGQNLIVENIPVNTALSYSFVGNPATTYYYTVTPYNSFGTAVNCTQKLFTTYEDGCYCISVPATNDGLGITNIQVVDTSYPVTDVTYADLTENGVIDITPGVNTFVNITFETDFAYHSNVWIDYNDNFIFEANELLYSGQTPSNAIPSNLNASFIPALNANTGEHRMRIVSSFSKQTPANPCYNGFSAVTIDVLVNVLEAPDCLPPTPSAATDITANSAQLNWLSSNTIFNVEFGSSGFPQGSGTIIPLIEGSSTIISDLNAQSNYAYYLQTVCSDESVSPWSGPFFFRTGCPSFGNFVENFTSTSNVLAPECWFTLKNSTSAYSMVQLNSYNGYITMSTADAAAASLYLITPSLTDLPLNTHKLSFKAFGPTTANIVVGTMTDPTVESTFTAVQSFGLTTTFADYEVAFPGSTTDQYIAFKYAGTGMYQTVSIDNVAWQPDFLSNTDFESSSFTAYPNPVKDMLTINYKQEIVDVAVYNLLGQRVLFMNLNANKGQLDMSSLTTGTYLVKVNSENATRTIKVLKQ